MPALPPFEYAVVRIVPRVEREEFLNAGVVLFCETRDFLGARVELDDARLLAFSPGSDAALVRRHLALVPRICAGDHDAGPIALLPIRERWRWIVSPSSTILQTSPAHPGRCEAPERELDRLFATLVKLSPIR